MKLKSRRLVAVIAGLMLAALVVVLNPASFEQVLVRVDETEAVEAEESGDFDDTDSAPLATAVLGELEVKGRAPKTGYSREEFYSGWPTVEGCNLRQKIIRREFGESAVLEGCNVVAGEFDEPYTGAHLVFKTREEISKGVQIDHVVALSDAWQKGAQYMAAETRRAMATDPLNLLAVEAAANSQKSDGDAATWLPSNKKFRCQYVARQIAVKHKYGLWVTEAEKNAMLNVLTVCPNQRVVL